MRRFSFVKKRTFLLSRREAEGNGEIPFRSYGVELTLFILGSGKKTVETGKKREVFDTM